MKIRIGILDKDERYTARISSYFNAGYSDKLELYVFNTQDSYQKFSQEHRIDVLLADPETVEKEFAPQKNVAFAYLSNAQDVETIRNRQVVCRYQKAELIYKEIVNLFAGLETDETYKGGDNNSRIITFFGAAGGVGTTLLSIACAKTLARVGKTVLYLNFEQNGTFSSLLSGEGVATFSDVLYSVKSKRANLGLKLSSMIRKDESGVFFIEPFAVLLDSFEMKKDDALELLNTSDATGSYEYIVVDNGSYLDDCHRAIIKKSSELFITSDGMEMANAKLGRIVKAIELQDTRSEERTLAHTHIVYNRFGSRSRRLEMEQTVDVFTVVNKYAGGTSVQVLEQIVNGSVFSKLAE